MKLDRSDHELAVRVYPVRPRALGVVRALCALLAGFVLAQLFGKLAGDVARAITHARGSGLTAGVVVPSMLGSELALLGVALATPFVFALPLRAALGLSGVARARVFAAASVGTVMLGPLGDRLMTAFSTLFPKLTLGVVPALREIAQGSPFWVLWPTFALLPGLAEELLFRGVLQRSIAASSPAVVLSGTAFALFHVDPVHVVGVLPLGLFLAWVGRRSSTWVTIVAHVVNNSVALLSIQSSELDVGYGADRPLPLEWLAASLLVFAVACALLVRDTAASVQMQAAHGTGR